MRILLLADSNSPHILRWAKYLHNSGCTINIFTFHVPDLNLYKDTPGINLFSMNAPRELQKKSEGNFSKLIYLKAVKKVKQLVKALRPDIVHSHYVSSYGLIGALSGFHPYIISVWGADIYNFPQRSVLHKKMIEYSLRKADKILSTSRAMAAQTKKFTEKEIEVTPFGIDVDKFKPQKSESVFGPDDLVIGTIKTLEKKYGVEYLIRTFKLVKEKLPAAKLKLLIVGGGSLTDSLKELVNELNLEEDTIFTGFIIPDEIPKYHNMLDVYVSLSKEDSESFGVAVLEASACEKPVVVSRMGGLPEVVEENVTGFVVQNKNIQEAAEVLIKLISDKNVREKIGKAGRERVIKYYNWNDNVTQMIKIYNQLS